MKDKVYGLFCLALSIQPAGLGAYTICQGIEWEPSVETVISLALGFERAGKTEPMWIYAGNEH